MKTVFSNRMMAHVWAQLNQPHGRSGSMRFENGVAYSYRTPVANIVTAADGTRVALYTSDTYSMTTSSKHMPQLRRAWTGRNFRVPCIVGPFGRTDEAPDHAANVAYLHTQYTDERDALNRVPADSFRVCDLGAYDRHDESAGPTRAHARLYTLAGTVREYCALFDVQVPGMDWQADGNAIIARRDRIANDPKRAEKRAAAAAARERADAAREEKRRAALAVEREKCADMMAAWLRGENVHLPYAAQETADGGALLRLVGDTVETSRGAEAPVSHVRIALQLYRRVMNAGSTFERLKDGTPIEATLGHFTLDAINADGSVRAGCHTFSRAEIERFAAAIGAAS